MMKLAVLAILVSAAAASSVLVSSQRNIIPHYSHHGYGHGVSARYFDKAETGLGVYRPLGLKGLAYDGYNGLGLGYQNLGLGYGKLGYGGLGYGRFGYGYDGLGYGKLGYGLGGLGYGRLGVGYGYGF